MHGSQEGILLCLIVLIGISGFFSGAETGLMAVNRYRLQHLAKMGHRSALRVSRFLAQPDKILGVILIGNTFANILASALATLLAMHWFGEKGIFIATLCLTLVVLIFAEIAPKTVAALYPQRIAFAVSLPLSCLLICLYPLVWVATGIANGLLRFLGVKFQRHTVEPLTRSELKVILSGRGAKIASGHRNMLLGILDLEKITVNDIMIPSHEVMGIDMQWPWVKIRDCLQKMPYTQLVVYNQSLADVCGLICLSSVLTLLSENRLSQTSLKTALEKVHFIPEGTPLSVQLWNFQREKYRVGLVVDEYGDIRGLVALSDILEEIVGHFNTDLLQERQVYRKMANGSYVVEGGVSVRDLNRVTGWDLPTEGPAATLSGLVIEYLETIPEGPVCLYLNGYPVEVLNVKANQVHSVRIWPGLRRVDPEVAE